jgi:hypothetical protein
MSTVRKFMIYGPQESLVRMSQYILDNTNPQYTFLSKGNVSGNTVYVLVYEEHQKLMNSSLSVTLILECLGTSVRAETVTTGGRMGFRGSVPTDEISLSEQVTDSILDFSKRFGLTIQEVVDKQNPDALS